MHIKLYFMLHINISKKFDGTVYTFGFGADHDASMLAAISTQGGGVYYFIDSNEKVIHTSVLNHL